MHPYPRAVALALALFAPLVLSAHQPVDEMVQAAQKFVASLDADLKKKAAYPLTDAERENWWFVPRVRNGVPLKELSPAQAELARNLMKAGLSQRGYTKASAIIALENVLREIEGPNGNVVRDPTLYYFTIFGTPGKTAPWGWRVEGHHVSLNFTIIDADHVQVTPSFLGSNPAEVRTGDQAGLRVLADEEDLGRALLKDFTPEQRLAAVIAEVAPNEIVTRNNKRIDPLSPSGLPVSKMAKAQSDQLLALVKLYIERYRAEIGDEALAKIMAAGWDKVAFAWAGGLERGQRHYYRIQGPTFLVEFDNSQNNGNHVHTVWRDFAGDFGRDVLREHYEKDHPPEKK